MAYIDPDDYWAQLFGRPPSEEECQAILHADLEVTRAICGDEYSARLDELERELNQRHSSVLDAQIIYLDALDAEFTDDEDALR